MRLAVLIALACRLLIGAAWAQPVEHACDLAAARAERDWNIPAGVLSAVGSVESGRAGPMGAAPWPWTINAAGRGTYFETKADAIAAVLALMARGYPYIDLGCFQIDIAYHPGLFRSLDEAFDPERNAQAAAQILVAERLRGPDWATAVARYHSATPAVGGPYLQRVRAALPTATLRGMSVQSMVDWVVRIDLTKAQRRDGPALPAVIYPAATPRFGREPQVLFLGPKERLPTVVTVEINRAALLR